MKNRENQKTKDGLTKKCVQIYDTSLRDGMQGMYINYTLQDKLNIAQALDDISIDYIEGGFPLANEKEAQFFTHSAKLDLKHAKIVSFGSTARDYHNAENDAHIRALLETETSIVTIVGKTSSAHVQEVLGVTLDENLHMIEQSVSVLKKHEKEVILDLEHFFDGYKLNAEYAKKILNVARDAGVDTVVLCDTNGGTLMHEVIHIMGSLPVADIPSIGTHFHNDCGVGVANSLISLEYGSVHLQGTINGWGERTGNANLCEILPNIALKDARYTATSAEHLTKLTSLSRFVAEKANIILDPRQPFVGSVAFSHKAGQHADVVIKNAQLIEHISAAAVGNKRNILLSELAGKSTIVARLKKYGSFSKSDTAVQIIVDVLKEKEKKGYEYEAAEASFELEMLKVLKKYTALIALKNYHVEVFKSYDTSSKTLCKIFLYWMNDEVMGAAVGVGPVESLDKAMRHALTQKCDFLDIVKLIDYKVRVVNPEDKTASRVRVLITSTDGTEVWNTIGVHENIIEASWTALVDSYEYYYNVVANNLQGST